MRERTRSIAGWVEAHPWRVVAGLTVLGALLRFAFIAEEGFWFDEFIIREQARMSVADMLDDMIVNDVHPPLYQFVMIGWYRLVGLADEFWLRVPSALVGTAVIPVAFALARHLFGTRAALFAASLVTVNEFAVYYAQEARSYSLLLLLSGLTALAWLRVRERASPTRMVVYAVSGLLLAYTHAFGILFLVYLAGVWFVARWRDWHGDFAGMRWLGVHLAMATAYLPWVPSFLAQAARIQDGFWIPRPTWGFWGEYLAKYTGHAAFAWLLVGLMVSALVLVRRRGRLAEPDDAPSADLPAAARVGFLLGWFVFMLGVPFVISLLSEPMMHAKSAIGVVLPICTLAGLAIAQLKPLGSETGAMRRAPALVLVSCMAVSVALIWIYNYAAQNREAWREMTAHVGERVTPEDVVVLWHPDYDYFYCYAYYTERFFPAYVAPVEMLCDEVRTCAPGIAAVEAQASARDAQRLWLLKQRASDAFPPGLDRGWTVAETIPFNNGVLQVLERR